MIAARWLLKLPSVKIKKSVVDDDDVPIGSDTQPPSYTVGETARFTIDVSNTGTQTLTNLKVVDQYDPSLDPVMATEGYEFENNNLFWMIDALAAGKTTRLKIHQARMRRTIMSSS